MPARVYFDTNIWIAAMDTNDDKNSRARAQFEQVRQGNLTLVISKWVFLEITKFIIDQAMRDPAIRQTRTAEAVKSYVTTVFANYGSLVVGMKHVIFADPGTTTGRILNNAYDLSQKIFGNLSNEGKCPVCHKPHDFYEYHGPYQVDFLHALLARDLRCQKMLTFDHDFTLLKDEPILKPLSIEVLSK